MERLKDVRRVNLPLDFQRPSELTFAGDRVSLVLNSRLYRLLKETSISWNVTEYTILLAAVKVFLYRVTLQEDLILITPTAGRDHPDLENQIGFYINNVVSRSVVDPEATFRSFVELVDGETRQDFLYQAYPFDLLLEDLNVPRETNRLALIDFGFTWNIYTHPQPLPGNARRSFDTGLRTAKTDLWLYASEYSDGVQFEFEYNVALFARDSMQSLINVFGELLGNVLENPKLKLNQVVGSVKESDSAIQTRVDSMFDFKF
jgi:non-ribosomal peptide synthetase component F